MFSFIDNLQTFLLNLFFVFTLYFIYHVYFEKDTQPKSYPFLLFIVSALSIILCMSFPIDPNERFIFDMRQLPFIIGALYGGRKVAFYLLIVLLSFRFYIGVDSGFYASVIIYPILFLLLWFLIPYFQKLYKIRDKVLLSMVPSTVGILLLGAVVSAFKPGLELNHILSILFLYGTQFVGLLLFVHFVERVRKERIMLRELKELEKLKIVSEIAASISHEVRNPLTVTKGFLQLMKDEEIPKEKRKLYINLSLEELTRAEGIITDYLMFARPSVQMNAPIELSKEVDYVIKIVSPYALFHNVTITFHSCNGLYIMGENQKLHQCLVNLAKNSIEAMPNGGSLHFSIKKAKENAIIFIEDTGIGMNKEQLRSFGTPYRTTKEEGTGLGTVVAFSIIKEMKGTIEVKSEVGKGTMVTISIPAYSIQ